MIREIIQAPNDALLTKSAPVDLSGADLFLALQERAGGVIADLMDTRIRHKALGLAAPQIGVALRVIVLNPKLVGGFRAMINPEIVEAGGGMIEGEEGCMSIGNGVPKFKVVRYRDVTVRFVDRSAKDRMVRFHGEAARLLQHEIDHLDGKLIRIARKKWNGRNISR